MKKRNEPNEHDVLRDAFDAEQVTLPPSLEPEAVVRRLKAARPEEAPSPKKEHTVKQGWPRWVALAAALAVIVAAFAVAPIFRTEKPEIQKEESAFVRVKSDLLPQFESDAALEKHFKDLFKSSVDIVSPTYSYELSANSFGAVEDAVEINAKGASAAPAADNSASESYSKTNTQVEGVDEADIVKTDGHYIYITRGSTVTIVDASTMTEVWSDALIPDDTPEDLRFDYHYENLYVSGDRLLLIRNETHREPTTGSDDAKSTTAADDPDASAAERHISYSMRQRTVALLLDISDRAAPKQIGVLTQDGTTLSTRMVGDVLYTVTNYSPSLVWSTDYDAFCVPQINGANISCEDVYIRDPEENSTNYLILTAWDTADPDSTPSRISLLGRCDHLYCSTDTLYVADTAYLWDEGEGNIRTDLYAFSFDKTTLKLAAKGSIPGGVNNQYSMDQYGDTFRITTTNRRQSTDKYGFFRSVAVSSLYTLDRDLKVIGKLENLADNEEVESTRFFGETAYVVTFENTDPLFVIDLSDPVHPAVAGEVKLPGFSSYMHPAGNGYLIGIGYGGDDDGADYDKLKLSLFDVSDPKNPKEVDRLVVKGAFSDAQYDPKAIIFDSETSTLGLPLYYELWSGDYEVYLGARYVYQTIRVDNGVFAEAKSYLHHEAKKNADSWYPSLFRGVTIGDQLFTVTDHDVKAFDLASCEVTGSLTLSEAPESAMPYYTYGGVVMID